MAAKSCVSNASRPANKAVAIAAAWLIYFRLLGRLAWYCADRTALAILSGLPASELTKAIAGADVARLTQIRGVGRKTAERLAVELRDKLVPFPVGPAVGIAAGAGGGTFGAGTFASALPERLADVHGALMTLGYRPAELEPVIARMDPSLPVPDLVKQGLAALRRM